MPNGGNKDFNHVFAHFVNTSILFYPLLFRRWPRDQLTTALL
jgi:hypothetical protein